MENELDDILSSGNEDVSSEPVAQEQVKDDSRTRDEAGRFAAKTQDEAAPQNEPETAHQEPDDHPSEGGKVPLPALREARQKERETKQENETLRAELAELRGQMSVLMRQAQPQQQQPTKEESPPDFWEDPNAFVRSQLSPFEQQMKATTERWSMRFAVQEHGQETVSEAFNEMKQAMQRDPSARSAYQQIMSNDHPYGALVAWHKDRQNRALVGNDPHKWFESEFEKRLSDPATQAKILERIRGSASGAHDPQSAPPTNLPRSLTRVPSGSSHADSDMSDSALFSNAMR